MSDTPRTGALLESILRRDRFLSDKNAPEEWVVHSRQLERELAAANRKIQRMENAAEIILESCPTTWQEDVWNRAKEEKPT